MIKCLIDVSVPEDSKCAKCCIYCDEIEKCKCACQKAKELKTEDGVMENCTICSF